MLRRVPARPGSAGVPLKAEPKHEPNARHGSPRSLHTSTAFARKTAMKKIAALCGFALLIALPMGGCVSQQEYDAVKQGAMAQAARNETLLQENQQLKAENDAKAARIATLEENNRKMADLTDAMQRQLADYKIDLSKLGDKINGFNMQGSDPATDAELQQLAAQFPDIMSYDGSRGLIRLNADLTFDSGSDAVKDSARSALGQLAKVLNDLNASKYDVRLVGHTDNQPISNPATLKRFGSNRVLSCFRAIAVEQVIAGFGVNANRMECSGWGEYQPFVENHATGGTRENRRVEIFLVPSVGMKTSGSATAEGNPSREAGSSSAKPAASKKQAPAAAPKKEYPVK